MWRYRSFPQAMHLLREGDDIPSLGGKKRG